MRSTCSAPRTSSVPPPLCSSFSPGSSSTIGLKYLSVTLSLFLLTAQIDHGTDCVPEEDVSVEEELVPFLHQGHLIQRVQDHSENLPVSEENPGDSRDVRHGD